MWPLPNRRFGWSCASISDRDDDRDDDDGHDDRDDDSDDDDH